MDNSLSMLRPVAPPAGEKLPDSFLELAKLGLDGLLAHLDAKFKQEPVGMIAYSSSYVVLSPFTKDVAAVRLKLGIAEAADTSDLVQVSHTI